MSQCKLNANTLKLIQSRDLEPETSFGVNRSSKPLPTFRNNLNTSTRLLQAHNIIVEEHEATSE